MASISPAGIGDDEKLIVTIPPIRCGIAPDIRSTAAITGIREYDERERTEPSLIPNYQNVNT